MSRMDAAKEPLADAASGARDGLWDLAALLAILEGLARDPTPERFPTRVAPALFVAQRFAAGLANDLDDALTG